MKQYDYREAMYNDIKEYIEENINLADYEDKEEAFEALNDEMWTADSVTGNGSGSYTFDREMAREYIGGNEHLAEEVVKEFCIGSEEIVKHLFDYERWDVLIRCYLLGKVLQTVLDELWEDEK